MSIEITMPVTDLGLKVQRKKHGGKQGVEVVVIEMANLEATIQMLESVTTQLKILSEGKW